MANLSRILMDPEVFPDPKVFNPQRFLDEDGNLKKIDQFVPFSIGRRICMGISLAQNTLFLFFVRMLQRISLRQTSKKVDPDDCYIGVTRGPRPFEVQVTQR